MSVVQRLANKPTEAVLMYFENVDENPYLDIMEMI
jgi:hypothetical protein